MDLTYLTKHRLQDLTKVLRFHLLTSKIKNVKNVKQCSNLIKILIEERELILLNLKRLTDALIYKKLELVTSDGDLLLAVDSLVTLKNIITGSNNLFLRSVNVKPAFYQKQYLDFTIIEFEL